MIKTLFWVAWLFLYLIARLPLYWYTKHLQKTGRTQRAQQLITGAMRKWVKRLLRHLGTRLTVEGQENLPGPEGNVVYAANHQSYMDIPIILTALDFPCPLLAKKEIYKVPFLRGWMQLIGCIPVDREDIRAAAAALKECEELLEKGSSLVIFPEGTRSLSNEVGEFKGGVVRVAYKAGADIVPVVIDGSFRILEGNGYRIQKCDVTVRFLPRIATAGLNKSEQKALAQQLETLIRTTKDGMAPH